MTNKQNKNLKIFDWLKQITLDNPDCEFALSKEDLEWMRRSAGISGSPNFVFESDGATITFMATDLKDDSADQSKIEIGTSDKKFRVAMKVENFKMMDGSYDVAVSKKGLSRFKQRYGERAKSVMYATATSMAKKKS